MNELIEAVKAWPVIIQGALGSALFWLVLLVGQKIAELSSTHYKSRSKAMQRPKVFNQLLRLRARRAGHDPTRPETLYYLSAILYRASRPFVTGVIWLALGHVFDSFIGIFGAVGYLGCLYYMFSALSIVRPIPKPANIDEEIKKLEEKLKSLQE